MFGFSLQKLIVLFAVVAAVWYGFKFVSRLQVARRADAEGRKGSGKVPKGGKRDSGDPGRIGAENMIQCPVCKAYVSDRGATNCGRPDCPY